MSNIKTSTVVSLSNIRALVDGDSLKLSNGYVDFYIPLSDASEFLKTILKDLKLEATAETGEPELDMSLVQSWTHYSGSEAFAAFANRGVDPKVATRTAICVGGNWNLYHFPCERRATGCTKAEAYFWCRDALLPPTRKLV